MFGKNLWTIDYLEIVYEKHLPALSKSIRDRIFDIIERKLQIDPVAFGKPLQHTLKGYRRARVGDYRIVYRIESASHTVLIVAIKHRKDVYDE